jgi:uncharacterized membrane protein YccC
MDDVSDSAERVSQLSRFRHTGGALVAELRLVSLRGDRGKLCAETVASVVLAVVLADVFNLKERWWVALSAYVLIRANPIVVIRRCMERLAGSIIGALAGVLLATLAFRDAWLTMSALALVSGLGIYSMLGSAYAYSWVLGTVTALMVLSDAGGMASPAHLALNRIVDVAVGVLATATISATSFSFERVFISGSLSASHSSTNMPVVHDLAPPSHVEHSRRTRMWQALQGALAISLIGIANHFYPLPNFAQSMVSVIAVLLVPTSVLVGGNLTAAVHTRMFNRLLGCLCAALFAAPLLPLIGTTPFLCLVVLAAGVWLAAHVQAGSAEVSYIGTQFGVGFIMIFVQDHAWSTDASAALQRLAGIILALLVLAVTMAAFSAVGRRMKLRGMPDV